MFCRTGIAHHRKYLLDERIKLGEEPFSPPAANIWQQRVAVFRKGVEEVNAKIIKLNLSCPALHMQQMTYNVDREVKKVMEKYRKMSVEGLLPPKPQDGVHIDYVPIDPKEQVSLKDVWREIKAMFVSK